MTDQRSTKVITDHVREEARKWRDLSGKMQAVNQDPVANDGLKLAQAAFFVGPTEMVATRIHFEAYKAFYESIKALVSGAVTEWQQLGAALDKIADEFDRTDQTQQADLEKIYTA
jgi:hypothetical protein